MANQLKIFGHAWLALTPTASPAFTSSSGPLLSMANLAFRAPLACMLLVAAALLCEAVQAEGAEPAAAGSNTAVAVPHTGGGGVANFIVSPSASAAVVAADEADKTKVANNFREQSIQLVRPRADGDGLEVVPEGIAFLRGLPATAHIHVVGVVGPFHGGKSFLLNQLLGHHGFKTGTDVNPTTKVRPHNAADNAQHARHPHPRAHGG